MKHIEIERARIHNLKDIDVRIPEKDLVVVASKMVSRWRERWPLLEQFVIPAVSE